MSHSLIQRHLAFMYRTTCIVHCRDKLFANKQIHRYLVENGRKRFYFTIFIVWFSRKKNIFIITFIASFTTLVAQSYLSLKAYLFWKCEFSWHREFWSLIFYWRGKIYVCMAMYKLRESQRWKNITLFIFP